jgi:hypothetical protein
VVLDASRKVISDGQFFEDHRLETLGWKKKITFSWSKSEGAERYARRFYKNKGTSPDICQEEPSEDLAAVPFDELEETFEVEVNDQVVLCVSAKSKNSSVPRKSSPEYFIAPDAPQF